MPRCDVIACRLLLAVVALLPAAAYARPATPAVRFEQQRTIDGTDIGIWYPAQRTPQLQRIGLYQ